MVMKKISFNELLCKGKYMVMALVAACALTACSNDDEGDGNNNPPTTPPTLDTPAYEASAAKYVVTDVNADIHSIELTASGNYIIRLNSVLSANSTTPEEVSAAKKPSVMKNPAASAAQTRYTQFSNILYGEYTKTGDNQYSLGDYGTLTVTQDAGGAYALQVERASGQTYNLKANKAGTPQQGSASNALCRTWNISQWRAYMRINGQTMYDFTANSVGELNEMLAQWGQENDEEYTEGDYEVEFDNSNAPEQVVFCKTGTYLVLYANNVLAVSTWRWANTAQNKIQYSWNPDSFDDTNVSGEASISYSNNRLYITEGYKESEDGYTFEQGMVYIMDEAK